jgi:VWFA-related protein
MSFKLLAAAAAVAVAYPAPAVAQAHREQSVYVGVVNRSGAPVSSVTADDFIVTEDGQPREVLSAVRATEPLRVALLVDTSQAAEAHVSDMRAALRAFVKDMHEHHDIALMGFGERPTIYADYTRDRSRLEDAIGRVFAYSGTGAYLLDAIREVADGLVTQEDHRTAIVVITTEGPEFSNRDHAAIIERLRLARATLHAFVVPRSGARLLSNAARERELTLSKGTRLTGGRYEHVLTTMALTDRLKELAAELDNQYRIVYARPGSLLEPKTVRVKTTMPSLVVRASRVPAVRPSR